MDEADLAKLKTIAARLQARDSDVLRFALKLAIASFNPLQDPGAKGDAIMPLFIHLGTELCAHFDLDADRLDRIVNADLAQPQQPVEFEDLELLALSALPSHYLRTRLREKLGRTMDEPGARAYLQEYLTRKYLPAEQDSLDAVNEAGQDPRPQLSQRTA